MSTDNNNPSSAANGQNTPSTPPTATTQHRGFVLGVITVLVLGCIVYCLSPRGEKVISGGTVKEIITPKSVVEEEPVPPVTPPLDVPNEESEPEEDSAVAESEATSSEMIDTRRALATSPEPIKDESGNIVDNNPTDKNPLSRVVIDDVGMVAKYAPFNPDGAKRYVYAGLEFLDQCHGRYLASDLKNPEYSRFKGAIEGRDSAWIFYIQPECLIEQGELNKAINDLNAKHNITSQTDPSSSIFSQVDEVTIQVKLMNEDIRQKAADAVNKRYNLNHKKLTTDNIELIPIDDITVSLYQKKLVGTKWHYVTKGTGTQPYEGRNTIEVTIRDTVGKLINGLSEKSFGLEIGYALSGHSILRNLKEQTMYGMWESNVLHDFYGKHGFKLKALQEKVDAGGNFGWDALVYGFDLAGKLGAGYAKQKETIDCDEWVEENDLMYIYEHCSLSTSRYGRNEFDGGNVSLQDLEEYFDEPQSPTIGKDSEGNYHLVPGNTGIPQSTLDKFCEFSGIEDSLKNIPKDLPPNEYWNASETANRQAEIEMLKHKNKLTEDEQAHLHALEKAEQAHKHKLEENKQNGNRKSTTPEKKQNGNGNSTPSSDPKTLNETGNGEENPTLSASTSTDTGAASGTDSIPETPKTDGILHEEAPAKFSLAIQLGYGKAKKTVNYAKTLKFYHVQKTERIKQVLVEDVQIKTTAFSRWVKCRSVVVCKPRLQTYKQEKLVFTPTKAENRLYLGADFAHKGDSISLDGGSTFTLMFKPSIFEENEVKKIKLNIQCAIQHKDVLYTLDKDLIEEPKKDIVALGTVKHEYDPYRRMTYEVPAYNLTEDNLKDKDFIEVYLTDSYKYKDPYNHARTNEDSDMSNGHLHKGPTDKPVEFVPKKNAFSFFEGKIEVEGQHVIHYNTWERTWKTLWIGHNEKVSHYDVITDRKVSASFQYATFQVPYVVKDKVYDQEYQEWFPGLNSYYFDNIESDTETGDKSPDEAAAGSGGTDK